LPAVRPLLLWLQAYCSINHALYLSTHPFRHIGVIHPAGGLPIIIQIQIRIQHLRRVESIQLDLQLDRWDKWITCGLWIVD